MKQKILLLLLQAFFALGINAEVFTGSCGANLTYNLDTSTGILRIDGSGDMNNYIADAYVPWFSQRTYIKTLNLSESITSIGDKAFYGCSNLTSVSIPNSVTNIGDYAFYGCSGLTSVTIPNTVTSIESFAFSGCCNLISVNIGNSVTSIGDQAFYNCSNLISVNIGNSVTSIGAMAFSYCSGLTSINIPNSVTIIEDWTFSGCSGLTSVTIPNSVTSIGRCAFSGCSGLTSITIPNSVTSIGDQAFRSCSSLITFVVESSNNYYCSEDNVLFDKAKTTLLFCIPTKQGAYTIPNSVTSIDNDAFSDCSSLTSVTIPNSVTSIGDGVFKGCSNLTSVTIPNSVTSIGHAEFYGCSSLTSVTIPNSVTSIGNNAFFKCSSLTSVTIPNSVTWIGQYAFFNCSIIKDLNWNANINDGNVFSGISSIKEIIIGDDVTIVYPFSTSSFPNKVVLGKNVQYVRQNAFQNFCGEFYIHGEEAPYCYPNVFQNANLAGSTLHVPAAKAYYYQTTEPWSKFGNIKLRYPCATPTISVVNGGFKFASETEGTEFHYTITTESNTVTGEGDTATLDDFKFVVSVYATADGYETSETAVQAFSASELGGVSGDMNDDGELTISDVTSLVDKIIKKQKGPQGQVCGPQTID